MPFRSKSQIRACYAQKSKDLKNNKIPKWNCDLWLSHTKNINKLPDKITKSSTRKTRKSSRKTSKYSSRKRSRKSSGKSSRKSSKRKIKI